MEFFKKMRDWFDSQSKVVRAILLIVPFCGWFFELCLRWDEFAKVQGTEEFTTPLVFAIISCPAGNLLAIVDFVLLLATDSLLLVEKKAEERKEEKKED